MKKLRIKDVIKFRKKRTESTKKTFIQNLKNERNQQNNSEARNYWVRSESAIKSTFKHNEPRYITDKLNELNELLLDPTHHSNTIKQYKHNVIILKQFENFDFNLIKPSDNIKILSQRTEDKILFKEPGACQRVVRFPLVTPAAAQEVNSVPGSIHGREPRQRLEPGRRPGRCNPRLVIRG